MEADKSQQPSEAIAAAARYASEASEEPLARDPDADYDEVVHDLFAEEPVSNHENEEAADADHAHQQNGLVDSSGESALLWTMDEETVLLHSSEASLRHIRTRLEHLLLGVSHALRVREKRGDSLEPLRDGQGKPAARFRSRPSLDFAEMVLAADHAIRRIVGEALAAFEEDEVAQMVQLCSLADRGPDDCDELVRNAVVVLQALTQDGRAVSSVEQFRIFVTQYREEMAGEQWRHDYVTAMRSLAVGFLREPIAIMSSYGSSINAIVEHEALYIGLLRLCGERPIGNTPHPKELPASLDAAVQSMEQSPQPQQMMPQQQPQQQQLEQHPAKTADAAVNGRASAAVATAPKYGTTFIHTPKNSSKHTHARRPSTALRQPVLPSAEDLQAAIGALMNGNSSNPTTPPKKAQSRQASVVAPTPSQLRELQKPINFNDSTTMSGHRASASGTRAEKPKPKPKPKSKPQYEPVPEVPQRLHLHRSHGSSMSHY